MGIRRRLYDRMPSRITSQLDMMRGFVSGRDISGQLDKLKVLLRFRREHDELREALTFYRYVFGLMVAYRSGLIDALGDEFADTVSRRRGTDDATGRRDAATNPRVAGARGA